MATGKKMMTPKEYTEQFRIYARGLDAEGWSQTTIAKHLGVPRETVAMWLRDFQIGGNNESEPSGGNHLSTKIRYRVANCRLDFQPTGAPFGIKCSG